MNIRGRYQGQSTLEYAVIIAVVVGALLAIQIYFKRGVQGKLRESSDQIGEQFDANKTSITRNTSRTAETVQNVLGGATTSDTGGTLGAAEKRSEEGNETVDAWQ